MVNLNIDGNLSAKKFTGELEGNAGTSDLADKSNSVVDYNNETTKVQIGYSGDGIQGDSIKFIAGYTNGTGRGNVRIKDVSKTALQQWLGLGSLAYSSSSIPTSLPANGGNSATVNGHTVKSDVPENAVFTDTKYDLTDMINGLGTTTGDPTDNDYFISQYSGGGETTKTYFRRPLAKLCNYIKSKADKVYSVLGHTHDDIYYTESEVVTKLHIKLSSSLKGSVNGLA